MDKFIPKVKLSKKAKRERAKAQRQTWGAINPVTRKPKNPKAYVREKPRVESDDDTGAFSIHRLHANLPVIARSVATWQSNDGASYNPRSGLLRFARNDGSLGV